MIILIVADDYSNPIQCVSSCSVTFYKPNFNNTCKPCHSDC